MNPFCDTPQAKKVPCRSETKSLSRIPNMTVGDVRHCFSQMRNTMSLTTRTILWCGITAGEFALQYLASSSSTSRKKRPLK